MVKDKSIHEDALFDVDNREHQHKYNCKNAKKMNTFFTKNY